MSSLYELSTIKSINEKTVNWQDIIKRVYEDGVSDYHFCINSELVDVNDRFRIIEVNGKIFVLKKTTLEKAEDEVENATMLNRALEDISFDGYSIKPVIPFYATVDDCAYIISEYKGYTLQEALYDSEKTEVIPFNTFSKILQIMLDNGIVYRGFIPRNIIVNGHVLYMIDFEDIQLKSDVGIDMLFITNFVLNWQYFYSIDSLVSLLSGYESKESRPLLQYESKFKSILNQEVSDDELRKIIFDTVVKAEGPIKSRDESKFEIVPTDLCHLISDLFGSSFDVLFDLLSLDIIEKCEDSFHKYIELFSKALYSEKQDIAKLRCTYFMLISMMIETAIYKKEPITIDGTDFDSDLVRAVLHSDFNIAEYYIRGDYADCYKELVYSLRLYLSSGSVVSRKADKSILDDIECVSESMIMIKQGG